jgi:hypothetical protein
VCATRGRGEREREREREKKKCNLFLDMSAPKSHPPLSCVSLISLSLSLSSGTAPANPPTPQGPPAQNDTDIFGSSAAGPSAQASSALMIVVRLVHVSLCWYARCVCVCVRVGVWVCVGVPHPLTYTHRSSRFVYTQAIFAVFLGIAI